jgi:hypothetical protein
MPPKGKKTKAEEALDFLSNLDNLDAPPAPLPDSSPPASATAPGSSAATEPRASTDSSRSRKLEASGELAKDTAGSAPQEDEEAAKALAFLEAQINTKRAPLSVPSMTVPRAVSPTPGSAGASTAGPGTNVTTAGAAARLEPPNATTTTTSPQPTSGWLSPSSFWSTASSAIQSAQKLADEGYKKVRAEGVQGVTTGLEGLGVKGMDLNSIRKGAEERLAGIAKNVDLEKLRK